MAYATCFLCWYLISLIPLGSLSKYEEEEEREDKEEEKGIRREGLTLVTLVCDKRSYVGEYGGGRESEVEGTLLAVIMSIS